MLPKNFRLHLFIWFWVILSFLFLSILLIAKASGLVFNFKAKTIEKTGLIVVTSNPKNAYLYLNGEYQSQTPAKLEYLLPGLYQIRVEKEGYHTWEKTEKLEAGKYIKEEALLFLKNPEISTVTNDEAEPLFEQNKEVILSEDILQNLPQGATDFSWDEDKTTLLYRIDGEIWLYFTTAKPEAKNKIVARFSKNIQKVSFFPDYKHILFIIDNELRIIETDGTNNTKLLPIPSLEFAVSNSKDEIYFKDGTQFKKAKVR